MSKGKNANNSFENLFKGSLKEYIIYLNYLIFFYLQSANLIINYQINYIIYYIY